MASTWAYVYPFARKYSLDSDWLHLCAQGYDEVCALNENGELAALLATAQVCQERKKGRKEGDQRK
jgi:hypothetical protein